MFPGSNDSDKFIHVLLSSCKRISGRKPCLPSCMIGLLKTTIRMFEYWFPKKRSCGVQLILLVRSFLHFPKQLVLWFHQKQKFSGTSNGNFTPWRYAGFVGSPNPPKIFQPHSRTFTSRTLNYAIDIAVPWCSTTEQNSLRSLRNQATIQCCRIASYVLQTHSRVLTYRSSSSRRYRLSIRGVPQN